MKIRDKRFLVTGGAGFIGSHIVDKLLEEKAKRVIIFDDFSSGSQYNIEYLRKDGRVSIVQGDILNFNALCDVMRKADIVSHQAAQLEIFRALNDPFADLQTNVLGTLNVLRAAMKCNVEKVINASSACVYGQAKYTPEDEHHPLRPQWPYGVSKLSAEKYCTMYYEFYGLPITNLRYGIVYGTREWFGRVITIFIKRIFTGNAPVIFGEGLQERDFISVSDVAEFHNLCVQEEETNGETYNVGTSRGTRIKDLAEIVIEAFGKSMDPLFENPKEGSYSKLISYRRRIPGELLKMVLDNRKAEKETGWKPKVDLKDGVAAEIEWFSRNSHYWDIEAPKV